MTALGNVIDDALESGYDSSKDRIGQQVIAVVETNEEERSMKKLSVAMVAAVLVMALNVMAQDTVTSVNVVGYYDVVIPPDGIALITPVLESFNEGTLEDIIGDQLPVGSLAWIWDRGTKGYVGSGRSARGGWSGTNVILRGDAVWVKPPVGSGTNTITLLGEVPGQSNAGETTTVHNISGIDAVGYAYPTDVVWTNTSLAQAAPVGSGLYIWNMVGGSYDTFGKSSRGGWSTPAGFTIGAGQGFWIRSTTPIDWEEVMPYEL